MAVIGRKWRGIERGADRPPLSFAPLFRQVPHFNRPALATADESAPIHGERDGIDTAFARLQAWSGLAGVGVPEAQGIVQASRGQPTTIRRPPQCQHLVLATVNNAKR